MPHLVYSKNVCTISYIESVAGNLLNWEIIENKKLGF